MSSSANATAVPQILAHRAARAKSRSTGFFTILESGFAVIALFLLTEGLLPLLRSEQNIDPSQGDPLMQALLGTVYLVAFCCLGIRPLIKSAFMDKSLLLLMVLVPMSAVWSVDPGVTLRRAMALLGTTIFAAYFAHRFTFSQQLKLVAAALSLGALLSIAFGVLLPKYGLMAGEHAGEWQGVYLHKNTLGRMMVLGVVCLVLLARSARRPAIWWAGVGLCLVPLAMSRSVTAIVVLALLVAAYPVAKALRWPATRWRHSLLTPILFFASLIAAVGLYILLSDPKNIGALFDLLGRDKTLTGRTDIWAGVLFAISKHPWLGYGYGAFWETDTRQLNDAWTIARMQAAHAHNGYLQLMLDSGVIGTALFLISLALTLALAVKWIRRRNDDESLWPLLYLIFMTFYNMSEPTILKHNNIFWTLYVVVALSLRKYVNELSPITTHLPRFAARVRPRPSPKAAPVVSSSESLI